MGYKKINQAVSFARIILTLKIVWAVLWGWRESFSMNSWFLLGLIIVVFSVFYMGFEQIYEQDQPVEKFIY